MITSRRRRWWCSALIASTLALACAQPQVGRIGPAFSLLQGEPLSTCEREEWYELAPARVETRLGAEALFRESSRRLHEGVGAFLYSSEAPELLEELWPKLQEPELERSHRERIERVDAANRRSSSYSLGAVGALIAGIGAAALVSDESPEAAAAIGASGMALGLLGGAGAITALPSGEEQRDAEARRRLLIPGEDDLHAAARGIDRANARRRIHCGGQPMQPLPDEQAPPTGSASPIARARPTPGTALAPGAVEKH